MCENLVLRNENVLIRVGAVVVVGEVRMIDPCFHLLLGGAAINHLSIPLALGLAALDSCIACGDGCSSCPDGLNNR